VAVHIRRPADLVFVAGNQDVISGRDQVRLDVVSAHPCRQLIGGQGVLGAVAGCATMADDDWRSHGYRGRGCGRESVHGLDLSRGRSTTGGTCAKF
jgi:hypothetical protein